MEGISVQQLAYLGTLLLLLTTSEISGQFSEDTFYQACSSKSSPTLCFGFDFNDVTYPKCQQNCDLAVNIFEDKKRLGKVRFQLYGKPAKDPGYNGTYIAVGLSEDEYMGDDVVVECVAADDSPKIYTSWNVGKQNLRMNDKSHIHDEWISVKDKKIFCDFTLDADFKAGTDEAKKHFNLKNGPGYHLFLALGNAESKTGKIMYHGKRRFPSKTPMLDSRTIVLHDQKDPPTHSGGKFYEPSPIFALLVLAISWLVVQF